MSQYFDWDKHYIEGGKSAEPENYGHPRIWKHNILRKYYNPVVNTIIDVGCGDLQLWQGVTPGPGLYTGIDVSCTIIDEHRKKFPERNFICASSAITQDISADIVICFDMLYHILDDDEYTKTLFNLKSYAKRYLLIYTFGKNPWGLRLLEKIVQFKNTGKFKWEPFTTDGIYQKYRDFLKYARPIFEPQFKLIEEKTDWRWKSYGRIYVFERVKT